MRGKKWVLIPHAIETTTSNVLVNMFEVPGGYTIPVTFGGTAITATVQIKNITGLATMQIKAIQPGVEKPMPVVTTYKNGVLECVVPLKNGCAMMQLATKK